jgi:hypothetical protein
VENARREQPAATAAAARFRVDLPAMARRFVVEVKLTTLAEGSPDRDGMRDALAYLQDTEQIFRDCAPPHALVVAWNPTAAQRHPSVIRVANQNNLRDSLASILRSPAIDS